MKDKCFLLGARLGAKICNTLPYAFLAGIFYGFTLYVDQMKKNAEQVQRQKDWKLKAEAGTWKPEA